MIRISKYILKEEKLNNEELKQKVKKWFIDNPYPKDDAVHEFSDKLSISPHKLEGVIYSLLSDELSLDESRKDVKNTDKKWIDLSKEISKELDYNGDIYELARGIQIEHEHDDIIKGDHTLSAKIAMAHIKEIPDYYTRLVKMEKNAEVNSQTNLSETAYGISREDMIKGFGKVKKEIDDFNKNKRTSSLGIIKDLVNRALSAAEGEGYFSNKQRLALNKLRSSATKLLSMSEEEELSVYSNIIELALNFLSER